MNQAEADLHQQERHRGDVSSPHRKEELVCFCHACPDRHLFWQLAACLCCANQNSSIVAVDGQTSAIAFLSSEEVSDVRDFPFHQQ
jgi:hypothetical protein